MQRWKQVLAFGTRISVRNAHHKLSFMQLIIVANQTLIPLATQNASIQANEH